MKYKKKRKKKRKEKKKKKSTNIDKNKKDIKRVGNSNSDSQVQCPVKNTK